jgi:hypothetical protein
MAFESYDPDLPDALQGRSEQPEPGHGNVFDDQSQKEEHERRQRRLDTLSGIISRLRDDAIRDRKESGIEEVWTACENAYQCIDSANPAADRQNWRKPTGIVGPLTRSQGKQRDSKSTAFVRLTARYVDMGAAKISEIVLPIDDKAFSFEPTPVPDLVNKTQDQTPVVGPEGQPLVQQQQAPQLPGQPPQPAKPTTVGDLIKDEFDKAAKAAEKAENRIYDWMVESRYPMQMRKVIFDAARLGVGVLKGPVPELRKVQSFSFENGQPKLVTQEKVAPGMKWIDPWNLFPHGACGEDIHQGDYVCERDRISESTLQSLKEQRDQHTGQPLYISSQIDKVIEEGPGKCRLENQSPNKPVNDSQYEIWYFYGVLKRDDFLALEPAVGSEDLPQDLQTVYAIITVVNDTVIGATLNPMETGHFPYRVLSWSRRAGYWAGIGIAEQVSLAQSIVNAATRRLLDNAGISSGAQIVVDQGAVVPADGNWVITPDKLWFKVEGAGGDDVRKAFMSIEFPNLGTQIMAVIQYGFKLAEEASNIPLISQGQTGPQDPQTFGQAELQNTNANSLLRNLGYNVDDSVTEPLVNDLYEWLLLDPGVPAEEKGDYKINARGSIAMVEKAIQEQTLTAMLGLALNPAYEMSPAKVAEEFLRAKRMDPRRARYTDEELQNMRSQPPPEAPAVTVAKIRAASAEKIAQQSGQITLQRAKMDTDRDTAYTQSLERRDQTNAMTRREELAIKREIAYLTLQINKGISVEDNKTKLADTVMKLNTTKQLAMAGARAAAMPKPPVEPAGRAPAGQSFQK